MSKINKTIKFIISFSFVSVLLLQYMQAMPGSSADSVEGFHDAVKSGDLERLKKLLKEKSLKVSEADEGFVLVSTSETGEVSYSEALMEPVLDIDGRDAFGNTALHLAVLGDFANRAETVRALLEAGVNTKRRNLAGKTALRLSAERGLVEVQSILMEHRVKRKQQEAKLKAKRAERSAQPVVCEGTLSDFGQGSSTQSR